MERKGFLNWLYGFATDPMWGTGKMYTGLFRMLSLSKMPLFILSVIEAIRFISAGDNMDIFSELPQYFAFLVSGGVSFLLLLIIYLDEWEKAKAEHPEKENEKFAKTYIVAMIVGAAIIGLFVGGAWSEFGYYLITEPVGFVSGFILLGISAFIVTGIFDSWTLHRGADTIFMKVYKKAKAVGLTDPKAIITLVTTVAKYKPGVPLPSVFTELQKDGQIDAKAKMPEEIA